MHTRFLSHSQVAKHGLADAGFAADFEAALHAADVASTTDTRVTKFPACAVVLDAGGASA